MSDKETERVAEGEPVSREPYVRPTIERHVPLREVAFQSVEPATATVLAG